MVKGGLILWPTRLFLYNYFLVIGVEEGIAQAYLISILRVVVGVPLMLLVTGAMALALSRRELLGRKWIVYFLIPMLFFSGGLIPYYLQLKGLGLQNTFWVFVIPGMFSLGSMILMRAFFVQTVPEGIVQSAVLEGAGYVRIFFTMVVPLSKAIIATIFMFNAVGYWNDRFVGEFFVTNRNLVPVQTWLQNVMKIAGNEMANNRIELFERLKVMTGGDEDLLAKIMMLTGRSVQNAGVILAVMPIIIVYPFLQRYFVKGALIGSLRD